MKRTSSMVGTMMRSSSMSSNRGSFTQSFDVTPSQASENLAILQLATTLRADLLRGVTLVEAMSGCCRHYRSRAVRGSDFELSAPAPELDAFVSHDWATSHWQKYFALSHLYNGQAACICSLAVAFVASLIQLSLIVTCGIDSSAAAALSFESGPEERVGWLAQVAASCVWFVVFIWWQRIRSCLGIPAKLVFLDKLCIHQTDQDRKLEGIYGLAGFLRASGNLVVLWSPRYFTRLWCAYELAAWYALHGKLNHNVIFYPLSLSSKILTWFLLMFMMTSLANRITLPFLFEVVSILGLGAAIRMSRRSNLELAHLHDYLDSFSIESTNCYCCSVDHRDPRTGFALMCDRRLVYTQLAEWQGKERGKHKGAEKEHEAGVPSSNGETFNEQHFVDFDRKIRTYIKASMLKSVTLTYQQTLFLSMPTLFMFADALPFALFQKSAAFVQLYIGDVLLTVFLFFPLAMRLFDMLYERLSRIQRLDFLIDVVAAFGCTVVLFGMWLLQVKVLVEGSWALVGALVIIEVVLVCLVYLWPQRLAAPEHVRVTTGGKASEGISQPAAKMEEARAEEDSFDEELVSVASL
eukprot:TRINITY_DN65289_c0_g1_i1.p1 TRINITY_DN65289_c0_g1~~TRINITY_DN65289_c0_g1_i1.p1  ORF type:complete len:580 (+),score=54.04 TRINITY_DN65289_c0_g1_i1:112-1851(+)